MPLTVQDNTFTTSTTSEAPSTFVAGMISFNGLVRIFGTTGSKGTSETETGVMTIPSLNNWFSRLNTSSYKTSGPTGNWAGEWWAVYNYLLYGGQCIVGATGSTGDYYFPSGVLTASNTPLHNKSYASFDAIFDSGSTASAEAAISVATTREDCVAIIGNYKKLTGVAGLTSAYSGQTADFGFNQSSPYVIYVAGRKKYVGGVGTAVNILESNLSPDVAGCMARSTRDQYVWISPAGMTRGRILGVVSMQQNFNESDSNYIYDGGVNPVIVMPGTGTFLMGNKTSYTSTSTLSRTNIIMMVLYVKKQLLTIAQGLLFEINDAATRQKMVTSSIPILDRVKSGNGITDYRIVCDETNNTAAIIAANQLVVDVYLNPTYTTETVQINIINSTTSEAFIA